MADVLKSIMNKITDDDPATRGQQLWVMFTLAIFLVAVLNYYAMVREPDIVDMDELIEYKNEVVKVEGEIISWREDPWNSGDWETHVIVSAGRLHRASTTAVPVSYTHLTLPTTPYV